MACLAVFDHPCVAYGDHFAVSKKSGHRGTVPVLQAPFRPPYAATCSRYSTRPAKIEAPLEAQLVTNRLFPSSDQLTDVRHDQSLKPTWFSWCLSSASRKNERRRRVETRRQPASVAFAYRCPQISRVAWRQQHLNVCTFVMNALRDRS